MNKFIVRVMTYTSWGLAFFSISALFSMPTLRMYILSYIILAILIGLTLDYLLPSRIVYKNRFLRYLIPLVVINGYVELFNLFLVKNKDYFISSEHWIFMLKINVIIILANYILEKKHIEEKKRINDLLMEKKKTLSNNLNPTEK